MKEGLREAYSEDGGVKQEISVALIAQSWMKIETSRYRERGSCVVGLSKKDWWIVKVCMNKCRVVDVLGLRVEG